MDNVGSHESLSLLLIFVFPLAKRFFNWGKRQVEEFLQIYISEIWARTIAKIFRNDFCSRATRCFAGVHTLTRTHGGPH
jgi:hypothetical protein